MVKRTLGSMRKEGKVSGVLTKVAFTNPHGAMSLRLCLSLVGVSLSLLIATTAFAYSGGTYLYFDG